MSQPDLFDIGAQLRRQFAEYRRERGYNEDSAQQATFEHLAHWAAWHLAGRGNSLLRRPARGVYVWGGAGRGKRFIMDCFFNAVPLEARRRMSFQAFTQAFESCNSAPSEPRDLVALNLPDTLRHTRLLCLDDLELRASHDFELLSRAVEVLLEAGTLIVVTSRYAPALPCLEPCEKPGFETAVRLFQAHFEVTHVQGRQNYRLSGRDEGAGGA